MRFPSIHAYIFGLLGSLAVVYPGGNLHVNQAEPEIHSEFQNKTGIINENFQTHLNKPFAEILNTSLPDTQTHVIPIRRIGRLFVIEATIDGESGNLIFDTGATSLVLNRTYFRDHVISGEIHSSGITGEVSQADRVTADLLNIGDMKFSRLTAHLADLGHIENRRGIKVLGLFGFEMIRSYEITLDIANNRIVLQPMDIKGNLLNPGNSFNSDFTRKIEISKNVIFINAMVGEKPLRFCFDTGAETNAMSSSLNKTILQTVSITRSVKVKGAGSATREVIYGVMNNFRYGDTLINNMETIITYMGHLNDAYGIHIDGVLGFDFISKGNFCFNFVKKQMGISYFKKSEQ